MSTLTKNERDGLEDVFLSIHVDNERFTKLRVISCFITKYQASIIFNKHLKQANYRLKESKLTQFLLNYTKKKKILSK